ncbi:hypothetical protein BH11ACT3_BH11ACT3_24480 [soil metagenome]
MKLHRTLVATAASIAIAGALVAGIVSPAAADTHPNFTPVNSGPSVPPIVPGIVFRPAVQLPVCKIAVYSRTITAARSVSPGFTFGGTTTSQVGASDSHVRSIAFASRHVTCIYGTAARPLYITFAAINSADYSTLTAYYSGHAIATINGGGPTQPGVAADKLYFLRTSTAHGVSENSFLSPDGWWITVVDNGNDVDPFFIMDATQKFLELNPTRS